MIETEHFIIPHLPKTGGDVTKQMIEASQVPVVKICWGRHDKHATLDDLNGKDLIITFRRLPSRALSLYWHVRLNPQGGMREKYFPFGVDHLTETVSQCMLSERCNTHDKLLACHLKGGRHTPKKILKSETLRDDVYTMMQEYYSLSHIQRNAIRSTVTKRRNEYDSNIGLYLTEDEIRELYRTNPVWTEMEREVYGDLMVTM